MVSRVLVAMDDSAMAEHALEFAFASFPDAEITVLNAVGGPSPYMGEAVRLALADDLETAAAEDADPVLARARDSAVAADREIDTRVALGLASRAIVNHAGDFDLVVIGAHGRDLSSRLLLGNVAETVTKRSPVPVLVVR